MTYSIVPTFLILSFCFSINNQDNGIIQSVHYNTVVLSYIGVVFGGMAANVCLIKSSDTEIEMNCDPYPRYSTFIP